MLGLPYGHISGMSYHPDHLVRFMERYLWKILLWLLPSIEIIVISLKFWLRDSSTKCAAIILLWYTMSCIHLLPLGHTFLSGTKCWISEWGCKFASSTFVFLSCHVGFDLEQYSSQSCVSEILLRVSVCWKGPILLLSPWQCLSNLNILCLGSQADNSFHLWFVRIQSQNL